MITLQHEHQHQSFEFLKTAYSFALNQILDSHIDASGSFDRSAITSKIAKLWFRGFLPNNTNLNNDQKDQMWDIFEEILDICDDFREYPFQEGIKPPMAA